MYQPLSYIHPGAKIAKNVVIEPFSSIDKNVVIGEGSWIGSNVTIMSGARIGKNVSIFPGSVISAVPQDLKFKGEETTAEIGDNTTLRECVTINRGTSDRNKTKIGKDCLIMAYSHVAHDCFIGDNCIFSNNSGLAQYVCMPPPSLPTRSSFYSRGASQPWPWAIHVVRWPSSTICVSVCFIHISGSLRHCASLTYH